MFNFQFDLRLTPTLLTLLWVLTVWPDGQSIHAEDTSLGPIPGTVAMKRLQSLHGRNVELVLQQMDGTFNIQYARVKFADGRRAEFDRHFDTLPGQEQSLIARYHENRLKRPFPETAEDRALLKKSVGFRFLSLDSSAVRVGPTLYQVVSIKPVQAEPPELDSAFVYRAVKLDPKTDPWQSTRGGGPSAWVIRYGLPDQPDQFEFRVPNPAHYPHQRVDTVVMHDRPEWLYDQVRREHRPAVMFTARHIGQGPIQGFFELDAEGFPRNGRYRGNLYQTIGKQTLAEIQKLRESALVSRRTMPATRVGTAAAGSRGKSPQRMLRYRFTASRTDRVVTQRTSTVSGTLGGKAVVIEKTVSEHLLVRVQSVRDNGTAVLTVSPKRYVVNVSTSVDGQQIKHDVLDTSTGQSPKSAVLRYFEERVRRHLGRQVVYVASPRGLLRPASDTVAVDQLEFFRGVQCGFLSQLLPLLPEKSFAIDGGWEERTGLAGVRMMQSDWWVDQDAEHLRPDVVAFRGHGDVSPISGDEQAGVEMTPFTAQLLLAAADHLPTSLTVDIEDAPLSGSTRLQQAKQRVMETLTWERVSRVSEVSEPLSGSVSVRSTESPADEKSCQTPAMCESGN